MGRVRDWWGSRHATRIRACRGLVNLQQGRRVGRKRLLSLWSTGRKDLAPSGETKFKLEMAQSITDAISTGGMWWNNGVFCNELINYAVRIVVLVFTKPDGEKNVASLRPQLLLRKLSRNDAPFFPPFAKQWISKDIPSYESQSKRAKIAIHWFGKY